MYFPSKKKFCKLKTNSYVTIYKEISNTNITPISVYENIDSKNNSFILESLQLHKKIGKYSIIGFNPNLIFKSKKNCYEIITPNKKSIKKNGNPLKALKKLLDKRKTIKIKNLCPFQCGSVGYFAYDIVSFIEKIPCNKKDDINIPDCYFVFVDTAIIFDNFKNTILLLKHTKIGKDKNISYQKALEEIDLLENKIINKETVEKHRNNNICNTFVSNYSEKDYIKMIERTKEYIRAGDIFQANLSQRFSVDFKGDSWELYKILRKINPSPFACFMNFDDVKVVSSSPERLVKLEGRNLETRPIAGTRRRGVDHEEDGKLSAELLLSLKERAEHIMLVDLERNDLGRVSKYGSVKVDELMILEKYSHVTHIVSNVIGELKQNKNWLDVLMAMFPGGTITGTPKVRCMEIIEELENVSRSLYTGSAGYISYTGDMDLNILIRTIVIKNNKAYIQAGGGIVADSVPTKEYHETLYKAEALLKAIKMYNDSLDK